MDPTTRPNVTTLVFPAGAVAWFICWLYDGFRRPDWPVLGDAGVTSVTMLVIYVTQAWDRNSKRNHQHVIRKHAQEYYGPTNPPDDTA